MGLLRLFLALVVALSHYRIISKAGESSAPYIPYLRAGLDGGHAVFLFYIISGFLISYALEKKYTFTPQGRREFYKSRFIRIFPLYWFLSAVTIVLAGGSYYSYFFGRNSLDALLGIVLIGTDWQVSFGDYPKQYFGAFPPFLNQAWTLGSELMFYLLAPFLLRSTKICLAVLAASAILRIYLVQYGFSFNWIYTFFPASLMFFLLGHVSRKIYAKLEFGQWNLIFIVPFLIFAWIAGRKSSFDSIYFYLYVASMVLFLPQLFENTRDSKVLNFLGDNSYPVYLSHIIVLALLDRYAINGLWGVLLFCTACIFTGIILHNFVERPLSFSLKHFFAWRISRPQKSTVAS